DHRRKNRTICPAFGRSDWITALPLKEEIRRRKQPGTPGQFWTPIADQSWKPIDKRIECIRELCGLRDGKISRVRHASALPLQQALRGRFSEEGEGLSEDEWEGRRKQRVVETDNRGRRIFLDAEHGP